MLKMLYYNRAENKILNLTVMCYNAEVKCLGMSLIIINVVINHDLIWIIIK